MNEVQPDARPVEKNIYELFEEWTYTWEKDGVTRRLVLPKGFRYDGASVPRFLWSVIGLRPDGLIRAAALVHDFLYFYGGKVPSGSYQILNDNDEWDNLESEEDIWTRKNSDRIFVRLMREFGVSKIKRRLAYYGVRSFGWRFFGKKSK